MDREQIPSSRPLRPRGEDAAQWRTYWGRVGQPWRTQPEIDPDRQAALFDRATGAATFATDGFPFKDFKLSRADMEWLVARNVGQSEQAPLEDTGMPSPSGLDLRGADLRGVDLSNMPLSGMRAGLSAQESAQATPEQQAEAAAQFQGARLNQAHLERAVLRHTFLEQAQLRQAHLEGADLSETHLDRADLWEAHLEGAYLRRAQLREAIVRQAYLESADLWEAELQGADLSEAHLEGADLGYVHLHSADLIGAHLEGADLRQAHLEGAYLFDAHLEGKQTEDDTWQRVRKWNDRFPKMLPAADLREAYFDGASQLKGIHLGNAYHGYVKLVDVSWGSANLATVDWATFGPLGDEAEARRSKTSVGRRKSRAERLDEYMAAIRATRQLAAALREQGLYEASDRLAYRALVLELRVMWRQGRILPLLGSILLYLIAGYGYRPVRPLITYMLVVGGFAVAYYVFGRNTAPPMSLRDALMFSLIAFHGRGFAPNGVDFRSPLVTLAAAEAVLGLLTEIFIIATFSRRFFGR